MLLARPRCSPIAASSAPSPAASPRWYQELRARWISHWWLKTAVIPLFIAGFFAAYFQLLRHPLAVVTTVPTGALDRLIPFQPVALVPYASLWIYVILGTGTLRGWDEIKVYCTGVLALTVAGLATFLFWPTMTPPADIDWALHPSLQFLKDADASGNACPSLHVAFALFTALWLEQLLWQIRAPAMARLLNAAWALAIAYSTVAIRQHVAVDVLVGAALGGFAGLLASRPAGRDLPPDHAWPGRLRLAFGLSLGVKLALLAPSLRILPPAIAAALFLVPDLWILWHLLVPNAGGFVPTVTRFATTGREVWLTIDDGPEPATTGPMLDLLDRHGAKATFFVIGAKAAAHPALLSEIRRRGHTLGNHTQTHPLAGFWCAGPWRTAREIDGCDAALLHGDGSRPAWFRAPAGIKTFFLRRALATRDQTFIGWSARALENVGAADGAPLRRLTEALRPGAILLLHESAPHAAARLALLSALLEQTGVAGYRCVLPARESLR